MKLLTAAIEKKLIANGKAQDGTKDFKPVVKFFGGGACTWLITEYYPEKGLFFGLCDLGMGSPELGYVSKFNLETIRFQPFNLPIERDMYSSFDKPLSYYAEQARNKGSVE
jgi:hypothetical protein